MGMLEEDCEVAVISYSEDHKILIIFVLLLVHSLAFSFSYVLLSIAYPFIVVFSF